MDPQVPIQVDEYTGVWSTDGLPMLYVPRHFLINHHLAVEGALGRERYQAVLHRANHESAYYWCEKEHIQHGIHGMDVFEHYLKRLSQRGWGQFKFESHDASAARATVRVDHSCFVMHKPSAQGECCYMFSGWLAGAMDWVSDQSGSRIHATCRETHCAGAGFSHCLFSIEPLPDH